MQSNKAQAQAYLQGLQPVTESPLNARRVADAAARQFMSTMCIPVRRLRHFLAQHAFPALHLTLRTTATRHCECAIAIIRAIAHTPNQSLQAAQACAEA